MSKDWIIRVTPEHARQLAGLRAVPGVEIAEAADTVWLRATSGDAALDRLLSAVAGERFQLIDGDQLVPAGRRVPTERLPRLAWQSLGDWSAIALPVAALPGQFSRRVALRLVRGGREQQPAALLADWNDWLAYATTAPEVRLRSLAFALSALHESRQRAFIVGTPLPPLAGQAYTLDDGIAVPCGWSLFPAVGSAAIRKLLALSEGDVAMFATDGSFERMAEEHFVRATRSAVRESARGEVHV